MRRSPAWTATITTALSPAPLAGWLEEALEPEVRREVPRATARLERRARTLTIRIEARDSGAARAALNTYLGWISLGVASAKAARGEALI